MKVIKDQVLGELHFNEFYWERVFDFYSDGIQYSVNLIIDNEQDQLFDDYHYSSFAWLNKSISQTLREAKAVIQRYVAETFNAENADLSLSTIVIPYKTNGVHSCVGFLFDSSVDCEHGFAAKYINGRLYSVGGQDIVI